MCPRCTQAKSTRDRCGRQARQGTGSGCGQQVSGTHAHWRHMSIAGANGCPGARRARNIHSPLCGDHLCPQADRQSRTDEAQPGTDEAQPESLLHPTVLCWPEAGGQTLSPILQGRKSWMSTGIGLGPPRTQTRKSGLTEGCRLSWPQPSSYHRWPTTAESCPTEARSALI